MCDRGAGEGLGCANPQLASKPLPDFPHSCGTRLSQRRSSMLPARPWGTATSGPHANHH